MPLSEHEQRLLDQIERALYAEDPKFATTVRSTDLRTHMRRRMIRMGVLFVIGFVMMLVGVIVSTIWVSVVGFGIALVALVFGANAYKRINGGPALRSVDGPPRAARRTKESKGSSKAKAGGSAKDRLEERWRKRWEERGGPQ